MNWLDVAILIISLIASFLGWRIGLITVAFGLAGSAVGIFASTHFHKDLAPLLTFVQTGNSRTVAAFIILFFASALTFAIVGYIVKRVLRTLALGWIDNTAGFVLGIVITFAAFSALLSVLQDTPVLGLSTTIKESVLGSFLANRFDLVLKGLKLIPRDLGL